MCISTSHNPCSLVKTNRTHHKNLKILTKINKMLPNIYLMTNSFRKSLKFCWQTHKNWMKFARNSELNRIKMDPSTRFISLARIFQKLWIKALLRLLKKRNLKRLTLTLRASKVFWIGTSLRWTSISFNYWTMFLKTEEFNWKKIRPQTWD